MNIRLVTSGTRFEIEQVREKYEINMKSMRSKPETNTQQMQNKYKTNNNINKQLCNNALIYSMPCFQKECEHLVTPGRSPSIRPSIIDDHLAAPSK